MIKHAKKYNFFNIATLFCLAIFFLLDRLLKLKSMNLVASQELISDFFLFSHVKNYLISFSLPFSGPVLDVFISTLVILLFAYIVFLLLKEKNRKVEIFLLSFVLLGAISNLVDRLLLGYVVDYLEIRGLSVFNLADVMISFGSFSFLLYSFRKSD